VFFSKNISLGNLDAFADQTGFLSLCGEVLQRVYGEPYRKFVRDCGTVFREGNEREKIAVHILLKEVTGYLF
jgi:hypothetical protein